MSTSGDAILGAVRDLYERHPYPRYPLLARPRWQDGYLAHSGFAASLAADVGGTAMRQTPLPRGERVQVLIGGSGEILPYIIRKWEPRSHRVISLDLSRQSLIRARWRLFGSLKPSEFVHGDLDQYLDRAPAGSFVHADAYGVVHHMADPGATLARLGRCLAPGGTLRLMVYNTEARRFILHLQRAFAMLGLTPAKDDDLHLARRLLRLAAKDSPALTDRLALIGNPTLANDARFADLFLHPREARLSLARWWSILAAAQLDPVGLVDRYGELDDLPNPLWRVPTLAELTPRVADRRFENNLELFLVRRGGTKHAATSTSTARKAFSLSTGPRLWYSFDETRALTLTTRLGLWRAHRAWTEQRLATWSSKDYARLPEPALARLARLGAILPGQLDSDAQRVAMAPLEASVDAPDKAASPTSLVTNAGPTEIRSLAASILRDRCLPEGRLPHVLARLDASRI